MKSHNFAYLFPYLTLHFETTKNIAKHIVYKIKIKIEVIDIKIELCLSPLEISSIFEIEKKFIQST